MTFKYTVSLNDPSQSPLDAALLATTGAAAAQWSRYLFGFGTIDIQLNVTPTVRANGAPAMAVAIGTDGPRTVIDAGTARELMTGTDPNGAAADLIINVDPTYLASLWLDPNAPPPASMLDGLSVLAHEIGHGLGVIGYRDQTTGTLQDFETRWDRLVTVNADGSADFTGAFGTAIHGGPVPVTTLRNGEQYFHLGNAATEQAGEDLMNGVAFRYGSRYPVSDLDLAIMQDLGLAVVTGVGGDPLLDPFHYTTRYPDVSAARVPSAEHYAEWGWREGRDPSAFFSTVGYRAANPDVAAAAVNPLQHYEQHGWREGRDAMANFDTALYLARNPDVRAAGIDPLAHFLVDGRFEGRQAYRAIGDAGSFTHGSFDAEYYLLANPDVASAALAAGAGNSLAFAYAHYAGSGWQEGRNPNSYFDVRGYLAAYGDVAAARLDPLLHYDLSGWHEGRDPAAGFDTKAYLSRYADVAAAGINPLQHFLQFGALEGRSDFADGQIG